MIAFLLGNKTLLMVVVFAAIVLTGGIYIKLLNGKLETCQAEQNVLKAELAVSQASVKSLSAAIDEQNVAVQKLKSEADERARKSEAALAKARATAEEFKKKAGALITRVAPQNISKCDAANQLFNEVLNAK